MKSLRKNKRGQTMGIMIISVIFIFIIGLMMINFVKDEVSTARTDLNCANAGDITDGTKLLCMVVNSTVPYWILLVFSIVIGGITSRLAIK